MVKRNKRKSKVLGPCAEEPTVKSPEDICITTHECKKNPLVLFSRLIEVEAAAKQSLERYEPILIAGPVGCGKSSLANKLAKEYCNVIRTIQISEHTDAKTLLGAYCCTEIPGQFTWRPGPLISSIEQGHGLVLEDIDRGSSELQLLITSVLRKLRSYSVNSKNILLDPVSGNPITHHPNFRLLMTRRFISCHGEDFRQESGNILVEFLDRYCFVITLPNFSKDETNLLISHQYPTLVPFIDRIMNIYTFVVDSFRNANIVIQSTMNSSRLRGISVRDLLKFCSRISTLTEKENFSELLLLNAVDCFLSSMCNSIKQLEIACRLAGELNLSVENARNILCCRSVEISLQPQNSVLKVGRTILPCRRTPEWEIKVSGGNSILQSSNDIIWPFASTRLSSSLLERLAVAVQHKEPVLLVGETGTGKTSTVQRLAYLTGHRLRVINLNQQSDSVDLMGGFKPVDFQVFVRPLREKFESLFTCTFKLDNNLVFLGHINTCFQSGRWLDLITLMRHPARVAVQRDSSVDTSEWIKFLNDLTILEKRLENITKSNKPGLGFAFIEGALVRSVQDGDWILLDEINLAPAEMLDSLSGLLDSEYGSLILTERGDNEPIKRHPDFHLFAAMNPATDVGKRELPVGLRNRFTEFYIPELDPCINVNKSEASMDLDSSRHIEVIRSNNCEDLATLARSYLVALNPTPSQLSTIVRLYSALRQAAVEGLVDGVGQRPHFSLRTLCRALIEAGRGYHGSILRSLYEGLLFSFGSQICRTSRPILDTLIQRYLCSGWNKDSSSLLRLLNTPLPIPQLNNQYSDDYFVNVEGYWLPKGSQQPISIDNKNELPGNYILTPSVQANLKDLARVVAAGGGLPVLLQGETSVGKTSLITYLAKRVGQVCYRINNHEHTDQQTYLGTYTVSSTAYTTQSNTDNHNNQGNDNEALKKTSTSLVFKDGLLVKAMRNGYWIILDELNLAPTEILEALNRVLDDNRSVFITETQETIKAHPHFRLFATQNPPGLYAGRKMLSRALRNRFIELHFDTIPRNELEIILEKKCLLPSSRAQRLVEVMHRLQLARCTSNLFQGKDSFITLRDLFRWAERYRLATCDKLVTGQIDNKKNEQTIFFDWDGYLADQGYLLLAGRVRNPTEIHIVTDVIESVFKRKVTESRLFDLNESTSPVVYEFLQPVLSKETVCYTGFDHIVWTKDMRRLLVLVGNALKYEEPVLLVGETGCGKTTICQLIAALHNQRLHCLNCHQCTEASDFLGELRPVRHSSEVNEKESKNDCRLFEWINGPLVTAMVNGDLFLLDEISLADDAVLERLNSLLEPERQLHLAECSEDSLMVNNNDNNNNSNSITTPYTQLLTAHSKFRFIATMNPGGDYGKKELSPALRNRFTEIWCPSPIFTSNHIQSTISSLSYNESDQLSNSLLDCQHIVMHNLQLKVPMYFKMGNDDFVKQFSEKMINFIHWYAVTQNEYKSNGTGSLCQRPSPTIRDLIVWIDFIQTAVTTQNVINSSNRLNLFSACIHGACLVFLDVIDHVLPNRNVNEQIDDNNFQSTAVHFLIDQLYSMDKDILFKQIQLSIPNSSDEMYASFASELNEKFVSTKNNELFGCEPFFISTGPFIDSLTNTNFIFDAPTPSSNLKRLLRAMQLSSRALLLEGSPGVGKTTLVLALAKASGHKVIRINLSEATEVSDLFGCDLPVEGAEAGVFAWKSGPFLQGLCEGHWIILDEMNLASQSVLESLNACLDHRGEVFIPELNNTFKINSYATRLFACQNPLREGGGRKGLPRSFLNRFTQVYMKPLSKSDQEFILIQLYPDIPKNYIHLMVTFNDMVNEQINIKHEFGNQGGPWEFNLRDLTRWCDLIIKGKDFEGFNPGLYVHLLYTNRMRTVQDKQKMVDLWTVVCNTILNMPEMFYYEPYGDIRLFNESSLQCGLAHFTCYSINYSICNDFEYLIIMDHHRSILESFLKVIEMGWMVMLNGSPGCGKRTLAHIASILLGQTLVTMCLSPTSDTIELLGSLEQRESGGLFEWIDSPLVKGIINGYWVLIENAQLCSPSVLDRLNSLLEPNGELLLSERGLDANGKLVTLKAHPNFRLILTVDEFVGVGANCSTGISRAMRNRGLEITFTEPIMQPHVDLLRLFTAINVPKPIAIGLVEFQGLFLEVCENQTSFLEFYSKCFNGKAQLLDNNTTTHQSINCHHLKRIPIGALISASHYAKQLLIGSSSDPSVSIKGLQVPKIETKKRKMQKMVTKKHDDINKLNNTDDDITTDEILIHILNYTYCHRQMNTKSIEFVKYLINYYVKHIRHTDPLHTELHSMYHLPVNYLHHTVNEIIQNRLPIIYRKSYTNLIQITLKEYYDKPLNIDIQLMIQRILLEQANFTDIQSELFDLKAFQFNESNMTMIKLSEWSNWPDLRWIPGWKHLIYSLENESDDLIYEWNKKLYLLLINELIQSTHHCIHQQFNDNQSYSLLQSSDLHRIPVLKIIKLSMENNIPSIWLDNYPGLSNLKEQWFTFLTNLSNHFLNYKDILTKSDDLLSNLYMKWISKAWIWLRLFGSRPLGDSFDWPERLLFHNQHIVFNNLSEDQSLPNLTIISQYFQSKLAPLNVPKCQLQLNALSVDWLQFGQLMNEFLIRFKTELNMTGSNNNDDGDSDDEEGEEEEMSNHGDGDVAMVHHNDDNPNDMMDFYCLWPWTMILLSKFVDIKLLGNTLQQQYDVNNNQWDLTESLRIYFRSNLLTLNRPKLLAYLSMATKCLYKINNCEQMRVMKQLLQELNFTIMNTNNSNSSIFLTFALKKLDWSLPNQLLNVHSVNQPDILGEWRSISHALIHITWPMLCEYGTCSFTGKLTVYGWRYRQQAIQKANHLLYLSPKQETTNMSKNEYLQCNNLEMIIQHAFNILYGIYQVVHSIQKVINSQNNDTNEEDTLSPIISINNLIELINWTRNVFNPSINLLKSYISNDKSNDWHRIIRLIELLIRYLEQLSSSLSNQKSNNNDVHHDDNDDSDDILNYKFILSNCWLLIGFLYLRCNCPYSPLDPYIVVQVEEEAVKHEINYIRNELQFRENMQKLASGAYNNSLLPSLINANPLNINGHVNCGLLHPWLGVLVNRLHYLKQKAETLKQQLGFSCENVLVTRQNSNFEYVEIRRRITSYITDFTEEFLLVHCLLDTNNNNNNNNNNIKRIEKTIELQKLRCWIETTSMLGDWLTEPNRLNTFADIITPFLYGLFYIYRGLRVMFHETIAQNNSLNVTVSSMITNLVTSLLPNTQNDNVILPVISGGQRLSRSLSLALELANSKSRRLIQQLFNSINNPTSFTGNVIGVSHRIHETQFRISSFILNLLWLHNAEKHSSSNVTDIHNKLIGRILNSIILPLNQHWKQIELERKQLAESRASLFLEADHRKQLIRNDLQGIKSKKMKHHERSTSPDLIDQSLNEEVDWRLRFSEIGCINAYTELGIHHNSQVGNFEKEKEIQQTVAKLEAIDKWLKNSLNGSGKYWIPEEKELVYFIKRLVYLLLLNSNSTINYPLNSSLLIDKHSTTQSVDISSIFSWHWHTVLYGFNLASWLSIESKFSLDPTIDEQTTLSYIGITAYMGQYDIRANPILPIHHLSKFSNTSFNHYCNTKSHCYNIYLDPIPLEEAEKLNVLMRNLEKQIKHILTQWPGQPSLLRLLVIIHRIESFTVSDPLIKFVTGVEMLWQVMQEWERDAAKHVSLNESSKEVCNLLVSWRKMELSYWLATLDSAEIQISNRCVTLWFHLYDLFLRPGSYSRQLKSLYSKYQSKMSNSSCLKDNTGADDNDDHGRKRLELETDRFDALIELFEKGPIGEFSSRWKLVASIYSALNLWPGLSETERSSSKRIVGNAVWFYAQFLPCVTEELSNLRHPIEKELKGLVNVTKWGHYSRFWSVKTNVDRCKKSIHKHVKKWESILQQPVRPIFENAVKIPTYLKSNNGNNNNDHICSSSLLKLEMTDLLAILKHCSFKKSFNNLQQLYGHFNEQEDQEQSKFNFTLHLKRLPSIIKCLHKHVYTMVHNSPIIQWTKHLRSGLQMWIDFVHELSRQTDRLNSTCPTGNQLAKFNKHKLNKTKCKSISSKRNHPSNNEEDEEEDEELNKTRQWYQEFTALQQRKRLALSDWLKVATFKHSSTVINQSLDISDPTTKLTESIDSTELINDGNEVEILSDNNDDDHLFEELNLPNLGLSYRRGQRQTQTGHMSRFLVQLHGDPWSYVNQFIGRNLDVINTDSEDYFIHCVCNRLSRLISLRASLPSVPGPGDGDVDTSVAILSEIGGPNNLSRLIGIMSDLLNQCSSEFKVCCEFTGISKKISRLVMEYANSLNVSMITSNDKQPVDDGNEQIIQYCTCYPLDLDKLKRIRISTQNLDQIIREHLYQWNVFWIVFQKQTINEPFNISKLSCLFGSEGWTWLTNNPELLSTYTLENSKQLVEITESYMESLKLAFINVLTCTTHLLGLNTFLWNNAVHEAYEKLSSSMKHLQEILNSLLNAYKTCNRVVLFASVFESVQQQINVEWNKIHCELSIISYDGIHNDSDLTNFHTTNLTTDNNLSSINSITYKSDMKFEQLTNRLVHSMLKAIEILYDSDQINDNTDNKSDQLSLLHHYSTMISKVLTSTLPQINKYLINIRSMLQERQSTLLKNEYEMVFQSRLIIIQCIYPLMDGLSKALCIRCIQFWHLLDIWFKLGEFAMQITGRIITEGFCRPANLARDNQLTGDENSSSSSSSKADNEQSVDRGGESGGTSLTSNTNDAVNAKDITNELECQEQIEGLLNDRKQQRDDNDLNKNRNEEDNNTNGIEMPDDDFDGQYDDPDLENCDLDNDDSEQLEQENFDDKMDETDGHNNDDLAKEMWASDDEETDKDDNNKPKRDSDGNKENDKTGGVEDDKPRNNRNKKADHDSGNIQEQKSKQHPESTEDDDGDNDEDHSDKLDELENKSPKRKKPKHANETPGNRTTVANEDIMQDEMDNESDQPTDNKSESTQTKPSDDHETSDVDERDQGLPVDIDADQMNNEEDMTERDVEDLPGDLFDNQMDFDADNDGEEIDDPSSGQLDGEKDNEEESAINENEINENNKIETMDTDEQNTEIPENVEVFPYHGAGTSDLDDNNNKSNAFGGDEHNPQEDDKTETNNVDHDDTDVNSSNQTSTQHSNQGNVSGEKYTTSTSQSDTSGANAEQQQQCQQDVKRNQTHSGPKPTSDNRSLSNKQNALSKAETIEIDLEHCSEKQQSPLPNQNSELFQHLPNSEDLNAHNEDDYPCVRDSATLDQAEQQLLGNSDPMKKSNDNDREEKDIGLENDNDNNIDDDGKLPISELEKTDASTNVLPQQNKHVKPLMKGNQVPGGHETVESDPTKEFVPTLSAQRPPESISCTRAEVLLQSTNVNLSTEIPTNLQIIENKFSETSIENCLDWSLYCQRSNSLARQLCETLRLVLEPTKASRLRGDYRTGKRINMRKIIPYLASQFRKDKIWLRRSQPSQREYRILIAVDDSSSMSENLCKQMTFESLTTVITALNLLEVGRIGVCSFGESVRVLHDLKDPWVTDAGPRVLSQFTFGQPKTSLVQLLQCTIQLMNSTSYMNSTNTNAIPSQLLLILSDGVFSEDPQSPSLQAAVRLARDSHIFPVCLILDDVRKKHSIFDLRRYCGPGKLQPYMDVFPLPYYLVLRDLACLPNLLADALRQWFELESSIGR